MLKNTEEAIKTGQIREPGNIGHKRRIKTKRHYHMCLKTNINNVNKTCALLKTTRGKDEPNIFLMRKYENLNISSRFYYTNPHKWY